MEHFENELIAQERATTVVNKETKARSFREQPTTAALVSSGRDWAQSCCYCSQQGHASQACRTVRSVENRRQSLRVSGSCFICLKRGHIARECRSNMRCSKCEGATISVSVLRGSRATVSPLLVCRNPVYTKW